MVKGILTPVLPNLLLPTSLRFSYLPPIPNPNASPSSLPRRRLHLRRTHARGGNGNGNPWGSNAEYVRPGRSSFSSRIDGEGSSAKKEKRKWWSDEPVDGFDDVFDAFDSEPEQIWDKIWIFKVFKSYGYILPAIITSMLLATGPKAFLMALALPLGQSAVSLIFDKLFGRDSEGQRPRTRSRRKSANRYAWEEDDTGEPNERKRGFKSWAATANDAVKKGEKQRGRYGGWDELDGLGRSRKAASSSQSPRTTSNPSAGTQVTRREKLSRGRNRETPLFIRLLVAAFPFLGSWIRLL